MMKKIFSALLGLCCLILPSADLDRINDFAEALAENGLYDKAVVEYKRLLFSENLASETRGLIWLKLAVCYRYMGDEAGAMRAFSTSFRLLEGTRRVSELYEEIGIFYLARGKTDLAREILKKIDDGVSQSAVDRYLVLSYLIDRDWGRLFAQLRKTRLGEAGMKEIRRIKRGLASTERRLRLLKYMDYFLPGLACAVSGDLFRGMESLLLNYFTLRQFLDSSGLFGRLLSGLIFVKFYFDSRKRRSAFLERKSEECQMVCEEKLFGIIFPDSAEN